MTTAIEVARGVLSDHPRWIMHRNNNNDDDDDHRRRRRKSMSEI
jgi:hypothetical protein